MEYNIEAIRHRQKLFSMTMKACFMAKLEKYHGHMVKYGIHIDYHTMESLTKSHSFEDNIELILCKSSTTINPRQAFKKFGNRLSLAKFFRWIYLLVQRTKAARILSHMNGVSQQEIRDIILTVAQELGVAYEYQLMMLHDDGEVIKLARHAVTCMMFYLNGTGSTLSVKDLLQAIMEVKPQSSRNKDVLKLHPVYVGGKQTSCKWKLGQLFKQPGLRISKQDLDTELQDCQTTCTDPEKHEESDPHNSKTDNDITIESNPNNNKNDTFEKKKSVKGDTAFNAELTGDNVKLIEDDTCLEDDETGDHDSESSDIEEVEIGLEEVSSIILGQNDHEMKAISHSDTFDRRISTIEMDYEQGKLHIEKHNITINEFSPIGDTGVDSVDGPDIYFDNDTFINTFSEEAIKAGIGQKCAGNKTSDTILDKNMALQDMPTKKDSPNEIIDNSNAFGLKEKKSFEDQIDNTNVETYDNNITSENSDDPEVEYKFYGCFTPFGAKCRPEVYGFRGPIHVWDEEGERFSLAYRDKVTVRCSYNKELPVADNNGGGGIPHQTYKPKTKVIDGIVLSTLGDHIVQ